MNFKKEEKTAREPAGWGQGISELDAIALSDLDLCVGGRERLSSFNVGDFLSQNICSCCMGVVRGQKTLKNERNTESRRALPPARVTTTR